MARARAAVCFSDPAWRLASRRHFISRGKPHERLRRHDVPRRGAALIEQAVRSVEAQTTFDVVEEIIVVNDGSRDGSEVVLERLAGEIDKLRIIKTPGLGRPAARNRAVREARGEFIAFLDGDDFWTPEKLERQLPAFARSAQTASSTAISSISPAMTRRTAASSRCAASIPKALTSFATTSCTTGRSCRPRLSSAARFSTTSASSMSLFRIGEDTEFCLRVAEKWRFCHVPGAFTFKRRHPRQLSARLDAFYPTPARVTQQFASRHSELTLLPAAAWHGSTQRSVPTVR